MWRRAWFVTVVACAKSPAHSPSPAAPPAAAQTAPTPADAAMPLPADAASTSSVADRGCKVDPAAEQACLARGADFTYGPTPFIYCSGVAADTPALTKQHAQAQQDGPCTCFSQRAIQERQMQCSMVPSMPGR